MAVFCILLTNKIFSELIQSAAIPVPEILQLFSDHSKASISDMAVFVALQQLKYLMLPEVLRKPIDFCTAPSRL
jgi:hypothetical protein